MDKSDDRTATADEGQNAQSERSVIDDVVSLISDGRLFVQAELTYQRTRLAYAASKGRAAALFGLLAAALCLLALFGLIVGMIIALAPEIGAWGAVGAVTGGLLFLAAISSLLALRNVRRVRNAFKGDE
jgi:uncharacterized membrane protein YqjE